MPAILLSLNVLKLLNTPNFIVVTSRNIIWQELTFLEL